MRVTAIAAVARNLVIGREDGLPWHLPEDFARFKQVTLGGNLIMGRVTFESIGKPLPGRLSIVVSRSAHPRAGLAQDREGGPDVAAVRQGSDFEPTGSQPAEPAALARFRGDLEERLQQPAEPAARACGPIEGVVWVRSLDEALDAAGANGRPIFIGGGAQLYRLAWPVLTDLDITHVDAEPDGDAHFPVIDPSEWEQTWSEPHDGFAFATYRRR
ncbi:MAG: dihydrofolate reductase [Propionibacteriaceae bacterium]|jgi:dihydrofolate reductase|nr:dihydrofolate reductase [Propionibacteriaceae bacterium]